MAERAGARSEPARFAFVTGNESKRREAERVFGRPLDRVACDLPEIQSLDLGEVLDAKAAEAWRRVDRPVIVEEVGLSIDAMGGFPGPLVKWMLESMGADGIARAVRGLAAGSGARVVCGVAAIDAGGECVARVIEEVPGRIVEAPRGADGFGWDPIFAPRPAGAGSRHGTGDGSAEEDAEPTYAEMDAVAKDLHGHRGRAWRRLRAALDRSP